MLAKTPQVGLVERAQDSVAVMKCELDDWLYNQLDGVVQTGPFQGMVLPRATHWPETRLAPLLLGCYEEELHGVIDQQVNRLKAFERRPNVVVVGSAEGYYAVGLARRLPKAAVYALDQDQTCLEIMARAARENDVGIKGGFPLNEVFNAPDFIFMDCEGAEVAYLDLDKFPALASAHMLVEIHNLPGQNTDDIILERFRGTHRIDMILEGPRNPNKYKELCGMTSDYRWMAVCEGRPCLMGWYSMTPRGMSVS